MMPTERVHDHHFSVLLVNDVDVILVSPSSFADAWVQLREVLLLDF